MQRFLFCAMAVAGIADVLLWGSVSAQEEASLSGQRKTFETRLVQGTAIAGGVTQPYALYVPPEYTAEQSWPLIVFLHGIGERGADGERQTRVGIGPAIQRFPDRFPCLVLMPQCSSDYVWTDEISMEQIDDALAQVLERYAVDSDRIALTGLSMGGFGTFAYGARNVDRFSATMPVCGGGNPDDAPALARKPMRVFHGGADPIVPPSRSRRMVEAVRAAGGDVEYIEYPDLGHNAWDRAYRDPDNIFWLLSPRDESD